MAEDFRKVGERVRNWGRWGDDDERGTVNLITPDCVTAAAQLVKRGAIFDLGIPFDANGPQPGGGRINPVRLMSETGAQQNFPGAFHYADDFVFMPLQAASQWDGLAHVFYDDKLYNGFPSSDVGPHGAMHCSIDKMAKGIVGRGVLLDIARLKGVDWLQAGEVITPDDLDAAASAQGVEVALGRRALLPHRMANEVQDGRQRRRVHGRRARASGSPAPSGCTTTRSPSSRPTTGRSRPCPVRTLTEVLDVHMVLIRDMGMTLGEILDLDELADDCAADGV